MIHMPSHIYIYNSSDVLAYDKKEDGIHVYLDLYCMDGNCCLCIKNNSIQFSSVCLLRYLKIAERSITC
jgi:hypothetical protein